jgi:glycerate 2-kinase
MNILIAPDKFKGSLGAREVAANIAIGLREALPNAQIETAPVADGGEGTASVISDSLNGTWIECDAHDPLGRAIKSRFAWTESGRLAVFEMSEIAGLRRLAPDERNPSRANTFGVGEMLLQASQRGALEIIIGLGGSATNDGGFGMARALGYKFFDDRDEPIEGDTATLLRLERIVAPQNITLGAITIAADVTNPLLGERGATRVFAPQKGATPKQLEQLEQALTKLAEVATRDLGCDFRNEPGAGAAGGLGFGLMTFCRAAMRSGFDVVAEKIQLEELIRNVDVVITGEGSLDRQTIEGKAPAGVAKLARKHGKRVFAIAGQTSSDIRIESLFEKVISLKRDAMTDAESIGCARELLRKRARELATLL